MPGIRLIESSKILRNDLKYSVALIVLHDEQEVTFIGKSCLGIKKQTWKNKPEILQKMKHFCLQSGWNELTKVLVAVELFFVVFQLV